MYDICVIGGGAAGLAASISAYENGCEKVLLIERDNELGGILNQCIHNGFGLHHFNEELSGPTYAEKFIDKLDKTNIDVLLNTSVIKITKDKEIHYENSIEGYKIIKAKAIIVSVGCYERSPNSLDISGSRVSGIFTAGSAQKYLNIDGFLVGKKIFILGSGDIGLIMARRLTLEGAKVIGVAEIMPYSNGLKRNIAQCLNDFNIPLYLSHTVTKTEGKNRLEKITLSEVDENYNVLDNTEKVFAVDTLLCSIGLIPENHLLKDIGVRINEKTNGAIVDDYYQTSILGIFACGNSLHVHDLVDYVSEEGIMAGKYASMYVKGELLNNAKIEVKALNNIRYVVPSFITNNNDKVIKFKFRVTKPFTKAKIIIKANNEIIKEINKEYLLPSEMENIVLPKKLLFNNENVTSISLEVCDND